jgi:anthranilate phosphoribosyltransferase
MMEFLEILLEGGVLSRKQAKVAMRLLTSGECPPSQIAAFLTALEMRKVTAAELLGFSEAMLEMALPVDVQGRDVVDLCGTGGDGKDSFNITTVAAFVVAGAGQPVVKHGNYGFTSSVGSSNLLEALGVNLPRNSEEVVRDLEEAGIAFLHAPFFHPSVKRVAEIRRELKFRTVFNLLGPLTNPARPKRQLIGVCSSEYLRLYSEALVEQGTDFAVVYSLDGYDELSLTGPARVLTNHGQLVIEPADLFSRAVLPDELRGASSVEGAKEVAIQILEGRGSEAQNAVVIANAALALSLGQGQGTVRECAKRAEESLRSGAARHRLQLLVEQSA